MLLARILKTSNRTDLLPYAPKLLLEIVSSLVLKLSFHFIIHSSISDKSAS